MTRDNEVDILFGSSVLRRMCNRERIAVRRLGVRCARRLMTRLHDMRAAGALEEMRSLPGRCHELAGARAGQLALDLEHPRRLVFEPANSPIPKKPDGGLDWRKVTAVTILGVVDYHG